MYIPLAHVRRFERRPELFEALERGEDVGGAGFHSHGDQNPGSRPELYDGRSPGLRLMQLSSPIALEIARREREERQRVAQLNNSK